MPAPGRFAKRPGNYAKEMHMKITKIKKKLDQFPNEWTFAFAARVAAQFLPISLHKRIIAQLINQEKINNFRVIIDIESWSLGYKNSRLVGVSFHPEGLTFHHRLLDINLKDLYLNYTLEVNNGSGNKRIIELTGELISFDKDFFSLERHLNSDKTPSDYLYQPLYASQSKEWLQCGKEFVKFLRDYGNGFDIWADWFQGRIDGKPTDKEFLEAVVNLPEEILAQEPAQINAYLKNLCQTERPLNRVRVIFLGYGAAGKTSLIRALNGLDVVAGKEQMTPGIDISEWQVPGTEIIAHFWDFGGQVVAHATHQFFLRSRCLYVLLLDGRTEINANEQAEYWLEHVRAFGNNAPVMLVGNKADVCAVNLDMAALKEKHPNVKDFYRLSCTRCKDEYALDFQRFQNDLSKAAAELGVHTVRFGKAHLAVLDELNSRSSSESFLKKTAWLDLCAASGLAEQGDLNQSWLLDLFDKLGVIVHFPNIAALDSYILNPRWLTYGVYTLLYSKYAKEKKGRLRESEIVGILSEANVKDDIGNVLSYPPDKAAIVIQAMEQFKLCFPCRHEPDMFVIPALLESDQPPHGFEKRGSLAFEFDFTGFLPRHIMPNFTVGRHDEIKDELVWQNGVVLKKQDNSAEALLQVDYHDRKLSLWVRGQKPNDYFKIIYDDLKRILNLMPELRFEERVIVPEESRIGEPPLSFRRHEQSIRADFQDLLALEESGQTEYVCKAGKFDLGKILQIMPRESREAYRRGDIFIHNPKGDIMIGDQPAKNNNSVSIKNSSIGGNVISNSSIQNSFNTVAQSAAEPNLKSALEHLCQQVEQMLTKLPEEKKEEVAQDLDSFVKEATKDAPRRKWYELSAEGLIEAAKACAGMTAPVTATVKGILELLQPA
jgi:GTPase SAR1 family protein